MDSFSNNIPSPRARNLPLPVDEKSLNKSPSIIAFEKEMEQKVKQMLLDDDYNEENIVDNESKNNNIHNDNIINPIKPKYTKTRSNSMKHTFTINKTANSNDNRTSKPLTKTNSHKTSQSPISPIKNVKTSNNNNNQYNESNNSNTNNNNNNNPPIVPPRRFLRVLDSLSIHNKSEMDHIKSFFRDEITGEYTKKLDLNAFITNFSPLINATLHEINHIFMKLDANSDGSIEWSEFSDFMINENNDISTNSAELDEFSVNFSRSNQKTFLASNNTVNSHTDMINCCIYIEKYDYYVTGSRDNSIKFWNAHNFQLLKTIYISDYSRSYTKSAWITSLLYLSISNRLAIASMDRSIVFIDPSTFECVSRIRDINSNNISTRQLRGNPVCLTTIILNNETQQLIIGTDNGDLLIYTLYTSNWHCCDGSGGISTCRHELISIGTQYYFQNNVSFIRINNIHNDWITQTLFESSLGLLITASLDSTIKLLDLNRLDFKLENNNIKNNNNNSNHVTAIDPYKLNNFIKKVYRGHNRGIYSLCYSKKYKFMASAGLERNILIWNPFTAKSTMNSFNEHNSTITQLILNDENNILISLSIDKTIKIFDIKNMKLIQSLSENHIQFRPENRIISLLFNSKHNILLLCTSKLIIYNQYTIRSRGMKSHKFPLVTSLYNNNFNQVVSVDIQGNVTIWDSFTGLALFRFSTNIKVNSACFDHSQRRLLLAGQHGNLFMYNFSNGQRLGTLLPNSINEQQHNNTSGSNNNNNNNSHRTDSGKHSNNNSNNIHNTHQSDNNNHNNHLNNNSNNNNSPGHSEIITVCHFQQSKFHSPLRYAISINSDRRLSIWLESSMGKSEIEYCLATFPKYLHNPDTSHTGDLLSLVILPPNLIATAGDDGTICIWHIDSASFEKKLIPMNNNTRVPIEKLLYLARKQILISISSDGMLRFWYVPLGLLLCEVDSEHRSSPTSMKNDPSENYLFTADQGGIVKIFDMFKLELPDNIDSFTTPSSVKTPTQVSINNSTNPHNNNNNEEKVETNQNRDTNKQYIIEPGCVKLIKSWQAHNSAIVSIDYLPSQKCILTGSVDCSTLLWTRDCILIGMFGEPLVNTSNNPNSNEILNSPFDLNDKSSYKGIKSPQTTQYNFIYTDNPYSIETDTVANEHINTVLMAEQQQLVTETTTVLDKNNITVSNKGDFLNRSRTIHDLINQKNTASKTYLHAANNEHTASPAKLPKTPTNANNIGTNNVSNNIYEEKTAIITIDTSADKDSLQQFVDTNREFKSPIKQAPSTANSPKKSSHSNSNNNNNNNSNNKNKTPKSISAYGDLLFSTDYSYDSDNELDFTVHPSMRINKNLDEFDRRLAAIPPVTNNNNNNSNGNNDNTHNTNKQRVQAISAASIRRKLTNSSIIPILPLTARSKLENSQSSSVNGSLTDRSSVRSNRYNMNNHSSTSSNMSNLGVHVIRSLHDYPMEIIPYQGRSREE